MLEIKLTRFILTMWNVNDKRKAKIGGNLEGFILTMWNVNIIGNVERFV